MLQRGKPPNAVAPEFTPVDKKMKQCAPVGLPVVGTAMSAFLVEAGSKTSSSLII
jgi:hypothetical protein